MRQLWLDDPVVEDDPKWLLYMSDGSTYVDADVSVTEADYGRMRSGYCCPWCYQILSHTYERTCKDWCIGGPDATVEDWHRYMDERFGGEKWIGPSREMVERANTPIWKPPSR